MHSTMILDSANVWKRDQPGMIRCWRSVLNASSPPRVRIRLSGYRDCRIADRPTPDLTKLGGPIFSDLRRSGFPPIHSEPSASLRELQQA